MVSNIIEHIGPELVIRFNNDRPIKASAFASTLRDLASDYKRLYNDDLIIVALPHGSLVARLRAFSKFAEASNHIFEFGKNIATIFGAVAVGYAALHAQDHSVEDLPLKAVESMAKLAFQSKSHLEVKYKSPSGEEIFVSVGPEKSRQVELSIKALARRKKLNERSQLPPIQRREQISYAAAEPRVEDLKLRLTSLSERDGGLEGIDPEIRSLIVALVFALDEAAPYRMTQLIVDLRVEGHAEAASFVEDILANRPEKPTKLLPNS